MTTGFTKNGKFVPTSGSDSSGVSSDQVEDKDQEPQMDSAKIEELKKKNQS